MPVGRPKAPLLVSDADRQTLERFTARRLTSQALTLSARIILRCVSVVANIAVAAELHVTDSTVGKWRRRFIAKGVGELIDEPRFGAPRKIANEQVEHVLVRPWNPPPPMLPTGAPARWLRPAG